MRDRTVFRAGAFVLGLHVLDDTVVQPWPGTPATDHLVSAIVPVALIGAAAWAYPRLRPGARATLALVLGALALVAGAVALRHAAVAGASRSDVTGLAAVPAGLALMALGGATLWRSRRVEGNRAWRYARRLLLVALAYVGVALFLFPFAFAYVTTHVSRAAVPRDRLGVAHEDVTFRTGDGLRLRGWYIPSRNGAAVIAFPGRNGPQRQARMLARHGYGVLLFDRRGEGRSDGQPNAWGWSGERDVQAAVRWLQRRPDVDPGRIGGIGLSVGGEMMIDAAARTPALRAIVSEGAGARAFADELDHEGVGPVDRALAVLAFGTRTVGVIVFANQTPPHRLETLVGRIAPRPILLIAAPHSGNGEDLNRRFIRAAGTPKELWEIPESAHVGGIAARPAEYERRVVGFFDRALGPGRQARGRL